jgi:hypothetical protein
MPIDVVILRPVGFGVGTQSGAAHPEGGTGEAAEEHSGSRALRGESERSERGGTRLERSVP